MIAVHVKLYASLRRYRPGLALGQTFACSVPDDSTVGHLIVEALSLPPDEVAIMLVNGLHRDREYPLNDGDQVALWPPIAGGAKRGVRSSEQRICGIAQWGFQGGG